MSNFHYESKVAYSLDGIDNRDTIGNCECPTGSSSLRMARGSPLNPDEFSNAQEACSDVEQEVAFRKICLEKANS